MRFARNKFKNSVLLWLAIGCLKLVFAFKAEAITLDWNSVAWTAGNLSQSFDIDSNNPGNDITITMTDSNNRRMAGTPVDDTTLTGGFGATQQSLLLEANQFANRFEIFTITITFLYAAGVDFMDFTLIDIDSGGTNVYIDQIQNIKGVNSIKGTTNGATLSGKGSAVTQTGTSGNTNLTLTGNTGVGSGSANGNSTLDFGGNIITSASFDYGNSPTAGNITSLQWVGLYDIHYRPKVPEVHPALAAMVICGLAIGLRTRRRSQIS